MLVSCYQVIIIFSNDDFETILSEVTLLIETTEKMIPDHLQNIEIEVEFPVRRRKRMKMMPKEKSIDELGNLDENSMFRVIIDMLLEVVDHRFTNICNSSLLISLSLFITFLLSSGRKYFERIKEYGNNMGTIIKMSGVDKMKILDELRLFTSCYSKLISTSNLNSETNIKELIIISIMMKIDKNI